MADIIKNGSDERPKIAEIGKIKVWKATSYDAKEPGKQKIIKARKIDSVDGDKEIPVIQSNHDVPIIEPIGNGENIEGIDIKCTCGETIRVYFEYEEDESESESDENKQ